MASSKSYTNHPSDVPTFAQRVAQFWEWYSLVAARFYQAIEERNCPTLADEVSENVKNLLGSFAWVFGPGSKRGEHSLTLSAEGDRHKQLLTQYWASCAPQLEGWSFFPARQPGAIDGWGLRIHDQDFRPIEFWLTPEIDEEAKLIHLTAWHPLFEKLNDDQKWRVFFLVLDEVLGEYGVQQWIGRIEMGSDKLASSIPIKELPSLIEDLKQNKEWKKYPPGEACTGYSMKKQHNDFPRGDVIAGSTMHMILLDDYLEAEGQWKNPLADYGAEFSYLAIPVDWLPQGKQVEARGKIEDALDEALRAEKSGRLLGGATGTQYAYIDLLLLDGEKSRAIVERVAREHGLPAAAELRSFATAK